MPVIVVAILSGSILGFPLASELLSKDGVVVHQVFRLIVISIAMVATAVLIMRIGNSYPLFQNDRYIFVAFWLLSIVLAKFIRFFYWKNKLESLL